MQLRTFRSLLCISAAAGSLAAASLPYEGKWKLNATKSDFGNTTIAFDQAAPGEMKFSSGGMSYDFKADGKEYKDPFGGTHVWKSVNADTWQDTVTMKGKVVTVDTYKIGSDGKALTQEAKGTKPNGESFDDVTTYQRVSGGPGLAGKWKTKNLKISSPGTLEISASGSDGLKLALLDMNAVCDAKFDGKDYPATGPTVPPNFTLAVKKAGTNGFEMVQKMNGKELFKSNFTVSADGKTLTENGTSVATNEKIKAVYDRQ